MGFGKKHGFYKQKGKTKDKLQASFFKERLIVPNALRKRVAASHHHELRSPQKRAKPNNFAQIEAAAEVVVPHIDVYPANAEPFAEPFSELMPRELRTSNMPVTASKLTSHSSDIRLKEIKVSPIHEMDYLFSATHGDGPPLSPLSASLQPKVPAVYAIQPPILKAGDDTGTSYHDNVRLDALLLAHTQHRIKKHNFYCPVFLKTIHIVLKIFLLFHSIHMYII